MLGSTGPGSCSTTVESIGMGLAVGFTNSMRAATRNGIGQ